MSLRYSCSLKTYVFLGKVSILYSEVGSQDILRELGQVSIRPCSTAVVQQFCKLLVGSSNLSEGTNFADCYLNFVAAETVTPKHIVTLDE